MYQGTPPNNACCYQNCSLHSTTDNRPPLLKTTHIQLIQHEVKLVPTQSLYSYTLVSLVQKDICMLLKEKCKHHVSQKFVDLKWCLVCQICLYSGGKKCVGIINQYLIWINVHTMRWTHIVPSWVTKNLRLHNPGSLDKRKYHCYKKNESETAMKWLLMTFIIIIERGLAQPSSAKVPLAANRNKYRYPQWDIMQRVWDFGTISPKWNTFIIFVFSCLKEPYRKNGW